MRHPRSGTRSATLVVAFTLLAAGLHPVGADEVLISNGDRLSGDVVRQEKGQLRLRTTYAGIVEIAWKDVREVRFDRPKRVLLDDETALMVEALSREGDQLILQPEAPAATVTVGASRVKLIAPEAWELGQGRKLTGLFNVAFEDNVGNSESSEFDLDFTVNRRWRWHRVETFGEIEYDTTRGLDSTDNWTWLSNYERLFRSRWYASALVVLKQDRFSDLRLRLLAGPAGGYRFFDSEPLNLRVEAGVAYLNDDFLQLPDQEFWGAGWYVNYDQKFWKERLQIYHRQIGFAAANDSNKQLWRAWTGVRVPLVAGIVGSVEYEIDYDSQPAVDSLTTDKTFNLKLGYKW
jgi:hypothetical protein